MSEEMRRLYRSKENRWIGGVCGGLGDYFSIDATVVRVLLMIFGFAGLNRVQSRLRHRRAPLVSILYAFAAGSGVLTYLISCVLIPMAPVVGAEVRTEPAVAIAS